MANFIDTYLDTQSNFSNDINLYSEGFRFDEQNMDFIEGQIALREVPILLEKEEVMSRMNLYGEAAGILAGLFTFIKSAIALMIKIFLGFKGIIIAVVVALIGRFIIKKFKGGSTSYSGGGGASYSGSVSSSSGIPAVNTGIKDNILKLLNDESKVAKVLEAAGIDSAKLKEIADKGGHSAQALEKIINKVLNDIRVEADDANTSAFIIPGYVKPEVVVAKLNKLMDIDLRLDGGHYSEVLNKNPYYIFDKGIFDARSKLTKMGISLPTFLVDCIRHYDGIVAASYVAQIGILNSLAVAYSGVSEVQIQKNYFDDIINEIKSDIPADTIRSIESIVSELKEYNGKQKLNDYFKPILRAIPNREKPKNPKDYIEIASILSDITKSVKETNSIKEAKLIVKSLQFGDDGVLIGTEYGEDGSKAIEYACIKNFINVFGDNRPDISKLKTVLNKLDDLGKHVQKSISDSGIDIITTKDSSKVDLSNIKEVSTVAINMVSCAAQSVNIMSYFLKNEINPIHNVIAEEAIILAATEYTLKEMENY
nr:MAG TPA: hypothetical protein [Caudoviricetes sp.]